MLKVAMVSALLFLAFKLNHKQLEKNAILKQSRKSIKIKKINLKLKMRRSRLCTCILKIYVFNKIISNKSLWQVKMFYLWLRDIILPLDGAKQPEKFVSQTMLFMSLSLLLPFLLTLCNVCFFIEIRPTTRSIFYSKYCCHTSYTDISQ